VKELKNTWLGDADLSGEFNSGDLVQVFQGGEYEDGVADNSTWAEGDWDGNSDFDSGDFVVAFQDGGFELGPRQIASVPEPSTFALVILGYCGMMLRRRSLVND
jgi:hypothetical protein